MIDRGNMFYAILHNCEYKEACDRCGAPLQTAVELYKDGKRVTVGRECAKHYGITWTDAVGPMADDPEMYNKAVDIWKWKHGYRHYGWPGGWEACSVIKEALGWKAWRKAAVEATK